MNVSKLLDNNKLLTRETALELFQHVAETNCYTVELDFSDIEFISRSFADQFHKEKIRFFENQEKEVVVTKSNQEVIEMFVAVSKTQNKKERNHSEVLVIDFSSRKTIKEFLYSF
jgi:hypothetical protein